jgi:nitroreductase/dihydropteridine reductase
MNIIEALNKRYATKIFDASKKLSQAQIDDLIEAGRLTATSYGLQLMKFVLVEDPEKRAQLVKCSFGQRQVVDASHLIVMCRERDLELAHFEEYTNRVATARNQNPEDLQGFKNMMVSSILTKSEDEQVLWLEKQVYIALGNMLTACAALDIDACPMEGFIPEEYDDILNLVEHNLSAVLVLPVGYRSAEDVSADRTKVRRSKEQFLVTI